MASIVQLLDASVWAIDAGIEGLAQCEVYAGQFRAGETDKARVTAPAVFVACLGAPIDKDPGTEQVALNCRMAAVVIARNARGRGPRSEDAVCLAEAVALLVQYNQFALADVGAARVTRLTNDYNRAFDDRGFASWTVEWNQMVLLGDSIWNGAEFLPTDVWLGLAPDIGLGHENDYWKIAP